MIKIHIMQHSKRLIGEEEMKRGVEKGSNTSASQVLICSKGLR